MVLGTGDIKNTELIEKIASRVHVVRVSIYDNALG
jgi:hypothetical protein